MIVWQGQWELCELRWKRLGVGLLREVLARAKNSVTTLAVGGTTAICILTKRETRNKEAVED